MKVYVCNLPSDNTRDSTRRVVAAYQRFMQELLADALFVPSVRRRASIICHHPSPSGKLPVGISAHKLRFRFDSFDFSSSPPLRTSPLLLLLPEINLFPAGEIEYKYSTARLLSGDPVTLAKYPHTLIRLDFPAGFIYH